MQETSFIRRVSCFFLCVGPFLAIGLVGIRGFRTAGIHHGIGGFVFAMFAAAAWILAGPAIKGHVAERGLAAIAGILLVFPFAIIGLLWVGIGPPWEASPAENQMRYVVLVTAAASVVAGCIALKEALNATGERCFSTLGFAGMILAGPFYLVGETILLAGCSALVRTGELPPVFRALSEMQDILLFFGSALTYVATAAFAISLYHVGWLGRNASVSFVCLSLVALFCLIARGLQFPDPAALSTPWYTLPGLVAGIPAVPFIIPYLLGVAALRQINRAPACPGE